VCPSHFYGAFFFLSVCPSPACVHRPPMVIPSIFMEVGPRGGEPRVLTFYTGQIFRDFAAEHSPSTTLGRSGCQRNGNKRPSSTFPEFAKCAGATTRYSSTEQHLAAIEHKATKFPGVTAYDERVLRGGAAGAFFENESLLVARTCCPGPVRRRVDRT